MLYLAHTIFHDGYIETPDTPIKVKTMDIPNSSKQADDVTNKC